MPRASLDSILTWLLVVTLTIQVNHFLVNRGGEAVFGLAFYEDNRGLAVYFGAAISCFLMIALLYFWRWRIRAASKPGWAHRICPLGGLDMGDHDRPARMFLRFTLVLGLILPMVAHTWLVHRHFADNDVYLRICDAPRGDGPVDPMPFGYTFDTSSQARCEDQIRNNFERDRDGNRKPEWQGTGHLRCIKPAAGPYCRIGTAWYDHFTLVGAPAGWDIAKHVWDTAFGDRRETYQLGWGPEKVTYIPVLVPGLMLLLTLFLLVYWIDTLLMIFLPSVQIWFRSKVGRPGG